MKVSKESFAPIIKRIILYPYEAGVLPSDETSHIHIGYSYCVPFALHLAILTLWMY